ncbi:Oxidoreductase molybdopterin binding domain-containing protein [Jatrophihabitans endophyticus]|uniref:Oxidoreductase molybdopterin binding domain-containing protein n=1 Tax=Jatrophihabitans endophyticus TaxID=1206085 RepID=A0A1M5UDJ3_9ACTN|nr:molybdopterin-dependent oxidoreductase [Jatrophihabitans endophyticus]SHH61104.1 Oxidoreductase molybdopterin binding domain-containing protein [Jatrophihabitans endophyticus]
MPTLLPERPPRAWPRFTSPLRSTALTARVGRVLGICFAICFVTGMLSHYQYHPWSWLPEPSVPVWGYRLTQGLHVLTGTISIPLLLVKLWSVYPKLFVWPPAPTAKRAVERLTIGVLVASALVELTTGFFNVLNWYPWSWSFVPVHRFLAYVVIGSILLHVAVKLPDIKYGLRTKLVVGDVLTEVPWEQNPDAYSNNDDTHVPPPAPTGISRRGALLATGAGVGVVAVASAGQTLTPLDAAGLLAVRRKSDAPQLDLPVNRTAKQARVLQLAADPAWRLTVVGGGRTATLTLAQVEAMVTDGGTDASYPIACVEGWSAGADWRGLRLADVVRLVGGDADSRVRVVSLEPRGSYKVSYVDGPQLDDALLATHLNGARLTLDHGYPLRLIAPNRAGVLNTKWLHRVEVL